MSKTKKQLTEDQVTNRKKYNIYTGTKGSNHRYYFNLHEFIQDNHDKILLKDIASMFGIGRGSISRYYKELGLSKYTHYQKQPFDIVYQLDKPLDRYFITNSCQVVNKDTMVILKPKVSKQGYHVYELAGYDGKLYYKKEHRLFGKAFIPNPKNKAEINHIYGDKLLNKVFTIEWSTREENMRHFHDVLMKDSINVPGNARINEQEALQIIEMLDNGESVDTILKLVPRATKKVIHGIKFGNTWSKLRK